MSRSSLAEKKEGALQEEGKEPPCLGQAGDVHRDWNKKKPCRMLSDAESVSLNIC